MLYNVIMNNSDNKVKCCYCDETFDKIVCRPYGKNSAWTCFPCGMKNIQTTEIEMKKAYNDAEEQGNGTVMITIEGLRPVKKECN